MMSYLFLVNCLKPENSKHFLIKNYLAKSLLFLKIFYFDSIAYVYYKFWINET